MMNWKNFRFNILVRAVLLMALALLFAFLWLGTDFVVVPLLSGLMVLGTTIELIVYLERSHRDLAGFLSSIEHDDFSTTFTASRRGGAFSGLYQELNRITDEFQRIRAEKEMQYQYLQTIVEHVEVGLLCYSQRTGEVLLMNKALQRMLRRPYVQHINGFRYLGPRFTELTEQLRPGQQELLKLRHNQELMQLSVRAAEFKLRDEPYQLISFQDIRGELEARDLEAWQELIRILTHEIMNSVTPVVSLTGTLQEMFEDPDALEDPELLTDARDGLSAIKNRGLGLMRFTQAYRDLTRLPEAQFEEVAVPTLLRRVATLFREESRQRGIPLAVEVAADLRPIQADPQLIEQVLINLIKNAMEALAQTEQPQVYLRARGEGNRLQVAVADNGPGIPDAVVERIFVPFYTTKEKGSGIGLSLSRQIMQLHKGSLSVFSAPGEGTTFTLVF